MHVRIEYYPCFDHCRWIRKVASTKDSAHKKQSAGHKEWNRHHFLHELDPRVHSLVHLGCIQNRSKHPQAWTSDYHSEGMVCHFLRLLFIVLSTSHLHTCDPWMLCDQQQSVHKWAIVGEKRDNYSWKIQEALQPSSGFCNKLLA